MFANVYRATCRTSLIASSLVMRQTHTFSHSRQGLFSAQQSRMSLRGLFVQRRGMSVKPEEPKSPITWKSLGLAAVLGGLTYAYFKTERQIKELEAQAKNNRKIGTAAIGGSFTLVDQDGKEFTEKNLEGKYSLIYFGFTFCPDICPRELTKIVDAMQLLDKMPGIGNQIQPIFVSVDPRRDTVAAVKKYIADFSPRLIGLTGSVEQVTQVTRAFRVYFSVIEEDNNPDYLIDHSVMTYVMDKNGEFVEVLGSNLTAEDMASRMVKIIKTKEKTA